MKHWIKPIGTLTRDERTELAIDALALSWAWLFWALRRHIRNGHD